MMLYKLYNMNLIGRKYTANHYKGRLYTARASVMHRAGVKQTDGFAVKKTNVKVLICLNINLTKDILKFL